MTHTSHSKSLFEEHKIHYARQFSAAFVFVCTTRSVFSFGEHASRAARVGHHWRPLQCVNTAHNGLLNPWIGFCFQLQWIIACVCFNQHVHKLIGIKSIVDSWIPDEMLTSMITPRLPTLGFLSFAWKP